MMALIQAVNHYRGATKSMTKLPDINLKKLNILLYRWSLPLLLILYLLSGLFIVKTDELGVVRRFGKVTTDAIPPGVHYRFPWPFERQNTPKTTAIKQVSIGSPLLKYSQGQENLSKHVEILTGDTNILVIQMKIQYAINAPAKYLFTTKNPEQLVALVAESVLTRFTAGMGVDKVLTVGKIKLQEQVKQATQQLLEKYGLGIQVVAANLQSVDPPQEVIETFNDVSSAKIDRQRLINEAEGKKGEILPLARGWAHRSLEDAKAYALETQNRSQGEAARFSQLLREYTKAKGITETRIYLETMEQILPGIKKYIINSDPKALVDFRFLSGK